MGLKLLLTFFCCQNLVQSWDLPASFYIRILDDSYSGLYLEFRYNWCPNGQSNWARTLAAASYINNYSVQFTFVGGTCQIQSTGGLYENYLYCFDLDGYKVAGTINMYPCKSPDAGTSLRNQQWDIKKDANVNKFSICLLYSYECLRYIAEANIFKLSISEPTYFYYSST